MISINNTKAEKNNLVCNNSNITPFIIYKSITVGHKESAHQITTRFRFASLYTRDLRQNDSHDREDPANWSIERENPITSPNNAIIVVRANESRGMSTAEWLCRPFRRDGKRKGEAHGENPIIAPYPTRRGTQSVWGETRRGRRRDSTLAHIRIDATARSPPCGLTNQNAASAHAIARKCAILYTVGYREAQSRLLPRSGRKMKPRV